MKRALILLLTAIASIETNPVPSSPLHNQYICSNMVVQNGIYSLKDPLATIDGIPADMKVLWRTGDIFFTIISNEMKMSLQVLNTNREIKTINTSGLGQSTAVDNLNDIVYLATDNGVYKYINGSAQFYTALGEDVMYVAVTDSGLMYIATWPQNRVHKIYPNMTQEMFPAVTNGHGLTIDSNNNIFFVDVATENLYVLKNGYSVPIKIKGLNMDKKVNVFVSKTNAVYAMDENSNFFFIDVENETAKLVRNYGVSGVNTFAMDSSNNVIIGVNGAIMKTYLFNKNPCFTPHSSTVNTLL